MAFYITNSDGIINTNRFIETKSLDYKDKKVIDATVIDLEKFPYIYGYYLSFPRNVFSHTNKKYVKWFMNGEGE